MAQNYPQWLSNAVIYNLYPQSFKDSNGDGIGDLPGIISKLDYIANLGVNVIWMNPIYPSPFRDAGYDISDYYNVAERYGTIEDLKKLIAESKKRGIRILLDFVPGHTSDEHPWFQESRKAAPNKYSNWYVWNNGTFNGGGNGMINGSSPRDANYLSNFFYFQPALNYGYAKPQAPWQLPADHPDVLEMKMEMEKVMRFWLDMGIGGFRVDMAASLVKGDTDGKGMKAHWHQVREWMERDYPDTILLSEWSMPRPAIKAGFHIDFMIHFGTMAYTYLFRNENDGDPMKSGSNSFFRKKGMGDITKFLEIYMEHYSPTKDLGFISMPTGNHDMHRISTYRTPEELKVAYAFLFTMPGVPTLYYGDEIGMKNIRGLESKEGGYNRTMARTPMQWDNSPNAGFSTASADKLYLPVDSDQERPTVAAQEADKNSLLEFTKSVIALRKKVKVLGNESNFVPIYAEKEKYPFIYMRTDWKEETCIVALNPSDAEVEIHIPAPLQNRKLNTLLGIDKIIHGNKLKMPPVSFCIAEVK